ncbi:hypothetical protein MHU86_12550 [Fragilaria crotonensis]|nr:hypothetical protein MHU86_12550 [Fragilaria crotonensis]
MTMTAQAALPSPPDPTAYHDPHHPKYGFHTEEWHDMPRPINGTDWFSTEERYRREANAHAYRQIGTPQNWLRYLTLGLFVYDDCTKFDSLWMKYSDDPIICHRMVWYNFLFHVDRKLDIPATLSAWATEVSQPYLQRHAPQYLAINSLEYTWNDYVRGDHDVMDIDSTKWTTVGSKKKHSRSRSPPAAANRLDNPTTTVPPSPIPTAAANIIPNKSLGQSSGVISDDAQQRTKSQKNFSSSRSMTTEASSIGKQSAMQQYLNVPTNDGTHRVTFRWKPGGDFKNYNEHSTTWLTEAHTLMTDLFTDDDCSLFRWESTDLTMSKVMSELSPGELREFLSPNIVFLPSTSQIIFGARICFAAKFPTMEEQGKD